jgi:acetolactate synthase-1/2/3 large subunit
MKLSDYVVEFVHRLGVNHLFMLTGGGSMHLVDSVGRNHGIEYVCCLHEQACAFAAEAYAEYSKGLGVVLVTSGPGGTNAITGLAAAWIESAACLFISGQAKRADLIGSRGVRSMGQQEVDIVSIVRPITKYATTILEPRQIRYELEKAVFHATHGRRGPVWVDVPLDVQASVIDEATLVGFTPETQSTGDACLEDEVRLTLDLLKAAERPVLLLGNGVREANDQGLVDLLVDRLRVPVLLTWKAADLLPESSPFYAGRPGAIGQRGANFTQQNSDCLLIIGARLDLPQTAFSHGNFGRSAKRIVVDIDSAEIRKLDMQIDVPVCADAVCFLAELLRQAGRLSAPVSSPWLDRCKNWQRKYPVVVPEYWDSPSGVVNPYVLIDVLSDLATEEDLLVPGSSGPCSDMFMQAFRIKSGQRLVNAPGLGAMGTGLPGSIGACLASGRKRTICVNGDGGFQLNIQDLETVRRLHLPIKYFVLCNGGYASIMATQRNYFDGRFVGSEPSSHLTLPDISRVAGAYGLPTMLMDSHENIREKVCNALSSEGPLVCAVSVSSDQPTAPRVTSSVQPDGTIVSRPMEDMWPLLSREEFEANMIVGRSPNNPRP